MTTIADEVAFTRILCLEQRRCERTGVSFAVVLIHLEKLGRTLSRAAMDAIGAAIGGAMRETDVTGWYEHHSTIGIILTTWDGKERGAIEAVMTKRIGVALSGVVESGHMETVRITFHVFPDDGLPDKVFYPDNKPDFKSQFPAIVKRVMDVAGSLTALLLLLPVFLIIAVLIKRTSAGPVFFRQKRIGRLGKEFTFLKFRSMYVNNDSSSHREYVRNLIEKRAADDRGTYKIKNDPRVTPFGRFLRKSSLDELPQFINALKGEMSLVGPRPPIPYEFEKYSVWHQRRILEAKPGITGEWQVHGRSRTTFDEMVRMDLRYIRNQSLWLDVKILLKTPFIVLSGDGAY